MFLEDKETKKREAKPLLYLTAKRPRKPLLTRQPPDLSYAFFSSKLRQAGAIIELSMLHLLLEK